MVKITCIKWPKIREKRNEIIRLFEQKNNRLSTFIKIHKKLPLNPEDEGSSPGNFILIMRLQIYC